jgi:hypothetical protein
MRKLLLIALILSARTALAQEAASTTQNPPEENRAAQTQVKPAEAPKPGHPLDPADVDVLTGKNKAGAQNPYGSYGSRVTPYISYSLSDFAYDGSGMYANDAANRLPFLPLLGRHSRASDFFFFDSSSFVGPRRFFFNHRAAANNFFFFSGSGGRGGFGHR